MKQRPWVRLVVLLVVLAVPVFLTTAGIRLITSKSLVSWEYSRASFPADPYGLPTEERIRLAGVCIDYILSGADISLLADLTLADGRQAFQAGELGHMVDVQVLYGAMMIACAVSGTVIAAGLMALVFSPDSRPRAPRALQRGGLLMLSLLVVAGLFIVLGWSTFFDGFHRTFFTEGTWTFSWSDTLIRLYPIRFWQDVTAGVVGLMVLGALVIGCAGWLWGRRIRTAFVAGTPAAPQPGAAA